MFKKHLINGPVPTGRTNIYLDTHVILPPPPLQEREEHTPLFFIFPLVCSPALIQTHSSKRNQILLIINE